MIACTLSNTPKAPTLTLSKALGGAGRISSTDQFTLVIFQETGGAQVGAVTTTGTGTVASGTVNVTGAIGMRYMLGESMASGSTSNVEQYGYPVSCTNALSPSNGGSNVSSIGLGAFFGPLVAGDAISCTITNTAKAPTLNVSKALGGTGRVNNSDQFTVQILQGSTVVNSAANSTSGGTGSTVTGGTTGVTPLTAGTSYTINEVMAAGSSSSLGQYVGSLSCTNAGSGGTSIPVTPGTAFTLQSGDAISCTLSNTAKAPTLTLSKALGAARVNAGDQFTVQWLAGSSVVASATTTGTGSTVTGGNTGPYVGTTGTTYTLNEAATAANLVQYKAGVACSNTGLTDVSGVNALQSTITPVAGDAISCVITNTPRAPTISINQITSGAIPGPGPWTYSYAGTNGWTTKSATSTTPGVGGPYTTRQDLSSAGATTLTPALPAGLKISNAYCSDANYAGNGNSGGFLGSFTDTSFTLAANEVRFGSELSCTFVIGAANPTLSVSKALGSNRINNSDQFTVQILQGSTVVNSTANSTSGGTGSTVTGGTTGVTPLTAGSSYTINEVMAAGSSSSLGQYSASLGCTNTGIGGTSIPVTPGTTFTPQAGDVIACTLTNAFGAARLTLKKITTVGTGTFTFNGTANANGFSTNNSYQVSTSAANTQASGATVTLAANNTLTEVQELAQSTWSLASASCSDANAAVTGNPASFGTLSANTLQIPAANVRAGADLQCSFTNTPPAIRLAMEQIILPSPPHSLVNPLDVSYTGNNGWGSQKLSSPAIGVMVTGATQNLAALNTASTISAALSDLITFLIQGITCKDKNAATTGNTGTFAVFTPPNSVSIPAANVKSNADFLCTVRIGFK